MRSGAEISSEPIEPSNRKVGGERSRCYRRSRSAADHVNLCLELQGAAAGDRHLNAGSERSARPPDARLFDTEREQPSSGEHVSARSTSAALASDEGEDLSGLDVSEGKAFDGVEVCVVGRCSTGQFAPETSTRPRQDPATGRSSRPPR